MTAMDKFTISDMSAEISSRMASQEEKVIREMVGIRVRGTIHVELRQPRWMPRRLYLWLMRSIVVESGPRHVDVTPAAR